MRQHRRRDDVVPQESPLLVVLETLQPPKEEDPSSATALFAAMERFADKLTPMESECIFRLNSLTQRLLRQEEEEQQGDGAAEPMLHHLELSNFGAFSELLLENSVVQVALLDCCHAASRSTILTSLTVDGLPERELELILSHSLPKSLQRLTICNTSRSQTISAVALCQRLTTTSLSLTHLTIDARIRMRNPMDANLVAHVLSKLICLQHLELHILPRISVHNSNSNDPQEFTLDCLLESLTVVCAVQQKLARCCSNNNNNNNDGEPPHQQQHQKTSTTSSPLFLHTVRLTAGYQHNYYHRSLIHTEALAEFLVAARDSLQELQLDNFGLRDLHIHTICQHAGGGGGGGRQQQQQALKRLRLAQHHPDAFSIRHLEHALLQGDLHLHECILWNDQECASRKFHRPDFWHFQQALHLQSLVTKCCGQSGGSFGHALILAATDPSEHALGALYELVRDNPSRLKNNATNNDD